MGKKVAILQSNYIPWKGYFDIINMVDLFVFHDDLQYTSQDWRNRNKIKTQKGLRWLSIPCGSDEKRLICEVQLNSFDWQKNHYGLIYESYHKAPYFKFYKDFFDEIYLSEVWTNLSVMNQTLIKRICKELLGIHTSFEDTRNLKLTQKKGDRVLEILNQTNASSYLSGASAKNYLDQALFDALKIDLIWMNYDGYKEYDQLYPPFEHFVSIIDLLFHVGPDFKSYMKSFR